MVRLELPRKKLLSTATGVALYVMGIYAIVAGLWILLSDKLASILAENTGLLTQIQSYKGLAFVLVTALLLFLVLRREFLKRERAEQQIEALLVQMFQAHTELQQAYDATVEGWGRALELRDQETQGHTLRVTQLTVTFARKLGIPEEEIGRMRQGALLHDIGKMAVSDSILRKPGPLSDDEREQMRMHPLYARDLLARIPFLKQSMEIPFCHHERWDGTGYPSHLSGAAIPLAARIFAIADVYDALKNRRAYGQDWTDEAIREHLQSMAGKHFDPELVQPFLELLDEMDQQADKPGT